MNCPYIFILFFYVLFLGCVGCECGFFSCLLLLSGWDLTVSNGGGTFQGANRTCRDANTHAIETDGLQIHILFTLGGDVGVATGVGGVGALARELINARHRNGRKVSRVLMFCKEGNSVP